MCKLKYFNSLLGTTRGSKTWKKQARKQVTNVLFILGVYLDS